VFPGWIGFSKWVKREFGGYPRREMLVGLAKMGKEEREENTSFGAYLWERCKRKAKVVFKYGLK
jgi:hypothetical protein